MLSSSYSLGKSEHGIVVRDTLPCRCQTSSASVDRERWRKRMYIHYRYDAVVMYEPLLARPRACLPVSEGREALPR